MTADVVGPLPDRPIEIRELLELLGDLDREPLPIALTFRTGPVSKSTLEELRRHVWPAPLVVEDVRGLFEELDGEALQVLESPVVRFATRWPTLTVYEFAASTRRWRLQEGSR